MTQKYRKVDSMCIESRKIKFENSAAKNWAFFTSQRRNVVGWGISVQPTGKQVRNQCTKRELSLYAISLAIAFNRFQSTAMDCNHFEFAIDGYIAGIR